MLRIAVVMVALMLSGSALAAGAQPPLNVKVTNSATYHGKAYYMGTSGSGYYISFEPQPAARVVLRSISGQCSLATALTNAVLVSLNASPSADIASFSTRLKMENIGTDVADPSMSFWVLPSTPVLVAHDPAVGSDLRMYVWNPTTVEYWQCWFSVVGHYEAN